MTIFIKNYSKIINTCSDTQPHHLLRQKYYSTYKQHHLRDHSAYFLQGSRTVTHHTHHPNLHSNLPSHLQQLLRLHQIWKLWFSSSLLSLLLTIGHESHPLPLLRLHRYLSLACVVHLVAYPPIVSFSFLYLKNVSE